MSLIDFYTLLRKILIRKKLGCEQFNPTVYESLRDSPKMLGRLAQAMTTVVARIYHGCIIYLLKSQLS